MIISATIKRVTESHGAPTEKLYATFIVIDAKSTYHEPWGEMRTRTQPHLYSISILVSRLKAYMAQNAQLETECLNKTLIFDTSSKGFCII